MGIGKDSIIVPVRYALGFWNCQEADPSDIMGRFNSFLRAILLRINEARDLGETDRFKLYDRLKTFEAEPPEFLRIDEKHLREYPIINCVGIVITTNHKTDGIYLPPGDRRHLVAWSDLTKEDARFANGYWDALYAYYEKEGNRAVAAFLKERQIGKFSQFDPHAPPPKTAAFWAIVDANKAPEEAELADILDVMGWPAAFSLKELQDNADNTNANMADWLRDLRHRRIIPHRLEKCGYVPVRNEAASDGLWKIFGKRQAIYAKDELSLRDRIQAATDLLSNRRGWSV
jgi:hypothetical protein